MKNKLIDFFVFLVLLTLALLTSKLLVEITGMVTGMILSLIVVMIMLWVYGVTIAQIQWMKEKDK